jgi:hypothetical protein
MKPSTKRVLKLLRERRGKGVSCRDFPNGFRLSARIMEIRDALIPVRMNIENGIGVYRIVRR